MGRSYDDLTPGEQRRAEELWDLESDLKSQIVTARNKLAIVQKELNNMHEGRT